MLDACCFAWERVHVVVCIDNTANGSITAICAIELDADHSIFASNFNDCLCEADDAWLVFIENQDRALSVFTLNLLIRDRVYKGHLEFFVRLPIWVIDDANLELLFIFISFHFHYLVDWLVGFVSFGGAVSSAQVKLNLFCNFFLDVDRNMAVTFRNLVIQMLKANSFASSACQFLRVLRLTCFSFV